MNRKQAPGSKRQALKEQRVKRERQRRLSLILGFAVVALVVGGLIIYANFQTTRALAGEIVQITPIARPMVDGTAMGDPNAPVKIQVFEDFQCHSCLVYTTQVEHRIIPELIETGQVYYVFHQYPFLDDNSAIKESDQAANASMCAAEQNRFWDYHDMLYTNLDKVQTGAYTNRRLVAYAETLGLNMSEFNACFEENRYNDEIQADVRLGNQMGVTGTPSVFVNGQIVSPGYVPTFEAIKEAVDAAVGGAVTQ